MEFINVKEPNHFHLLFTSRASGELEIIEYFWNMCGTLLTAVDVLIYLIFKTISVNRHNFYPLDSDGENQDSFQ